MPSAHTTGPHTVFCGLTTLDVTQHVSRIPARNEKVVANATAIDVGGPAANAARTASLLGTSAHLVTLLGAGIFPDIARKILTSHPAHVRVTDLAKDSDFPVSSIFVDDAGARTVASRNNSGRQSLPVDPHILAEAAALEVDGHLLPAQITLARAAHARTMPVILDAGSYKPGLEDLLPYISHVVCSADFHFPGRTPETAGDDLARYGIPFVAQSYGGNAVVVHHQEKAIPVPEVTVVDTLGAGDVLHGAFTAYLARGMESVAALEAAVAVASRSVEHRGVLGWADDFAEREFLP